MSSAERLRRLQRRACNQRAVLVTTGGPSLNRTHLGFPRSKTVIGANKIFLGIPGFCFYPDYNVAVNEKVIAQSVAATRAMTCVKMISRRRAALRPEDARAYHLETQDPPARFCGDISRGIHEGWTITYATLQVAYHREAREALIIGMDHRYDVIASPNEARCLDRPNRDHASPVYWAGQTWDDPDLACSEESYRVARPEYEKDDCRIIDATLDGACPVFEKAGQRKLFGLPQ